MGGIVNISKSKYTDLLRCEKMFWMDCYHPEQAIISADSKHQMEEGRRFEAEAKRIFGDYVDCTVRKGDRLDFNEMINITKHHIQIGTENIAEGTFSHSGLFCMADLLHRTAPLTYDLYEIKGSASPKDIYYDDIAYQCYVLRKCGIKISGCYLILVNKDYVRGTELDLSEFLNVVDVSGELRSRFDIIEPKLHFAGSIMKVKDEMVYRITENCDKPYPCKYREFCGRTLPKPCVLDVYRIQDKYKYLENPDTISFEDLYYSHVKLNDIQRRQIDFYFHNTKETYVDKEGLKKYLEGITYPVYYLDFETIQPTVPPFEGTKPFDLIPFQYSLHIEESKDGELRHEEFLAEEGTDPRRAIAESLVANIPQNVTVIAYNISFEGSRLRELAAAFPDLASHLTAIADHLVDLIVPFREGWVYNKEMGGSFSLKSVLPALFPEDPALNYGNLEGVHYGVEAMDAYLNLPNLAPEEREEKRSQLLRYCELDTFATVKILHKLNMLVGD